MALFLIANVPFFPVYQIFNRHDGISNARIIVGLKLWISASQTIGSNSKWLLARSVELTPHLYRKSAHLFATKRLRVKAQ